MARNVFDISHGDRIGIRDVAIVITDGQSNIDAHRVKEEADLAKQQVPWP